MCLLFRSAGRCNAACIAGCLLINEYRLLQFLGSLDSVTLCIYGWHRGSRESILQSPEIFINTEVQISASAFFSFFLVFAIVYNSQVPAAEYISF